MTCSPVERAPRPAGTRARARARAPSSRAGRTGRRPGEPLGQAAGQLGREPERRVVALLARVVAEREPAAHERRAVEPGRVRVDVLGLGQARDGVPLGAIAAQLAVDAQVEVRGEVPADARVRGREEARVARLALGRRVGAEAEVAVEEVAPHAHDEVHGHRAPGVRAVVVVLRTRVERLMIGARRDDEVPGVEQREVAVVAKGAGDVRPSCSS